MIRREREREREERKREQEEIEASRLREEEMVCFNKSRNCKNTEFLQIK